MNLRSSIHIVAVMLIAVAGGCADNHFVGPGSENEPPTVWLSSAPPEGSVSQYILHMFWGGWDPDGEISHFEYAITDNESGVFNPADTVGAWNNITGNDSTFMFSADVFADTTNPNWRDQINDAFEFQRSHTFFIRAVDDDGVRSKVVYRSFTARTLSPVVNVDIPQRTLLNAAQVPPITTFKWTGRDFVQTKSQEQEPDFSRHILVPLRLHGNDWDQAMEYIRKNPKADEWSEWINYRAPNDSGQTWTSPPLDFGPYLFAVQVMDEAGAVNPVFSLETNTRRVLVSPRKTGPIFRLSNDYIGTIVTSSPDHPLTFLDLPAGVPMGFCFRASAEDYGGIVSGYRYGWDIVDLSDDRQWETTLTPFVGKEACSSTRTFFFGTHTFYAEVVDNSGFRSRIGVRLNIVPFTMGREVLVIDDWIEGSPSTAGWARSKGAVPSDAEHDQFWRDMLSDVDGFTPSLDMLEVGPGTGLSEVPVTKLADYQALIWSAQGLHNAQSASVLADVIRWKDPDANTTTGRVQPNVVRLFMAAGGHAMLAGEQILTTVINRKSFGQIPPVFPFIFRYEIAGDQDGVYNDQDVGRRGVGDNAFAYQECCVNVLDIAYISSTLYRRPPAQQKPPGRGCPVHELRDHGKVNALTDGLRGATPVDATYDMPHLSLRDEAGGEGRYYEKAGLNTEMYNPPYFDELTPCGGPGGLAEMTPPRPCFQPMYLLECPNESSNVYGAPVAFWTNVYAERVPDNGGVGARSCVFGFHPVFMDPAQFQQVMDFILFDEWQLPRKSDS